jgi:predicted DsbA family dithiol-disulfide isomerase
MRQMAQEQYGLALNEGPFGIDSRPALIGAKYAEAQGMGAAYHQAVFRAYWQEGQDIGDTAVLENIAVRVGLDRAAFGAALADTAYTHQVIADIEQARQYGLSGVPALVFANKYLVVGAQPYTLLEEVVQKVLAEA